VFTWRIGSSQHGTYTIPFTVSDGQQATTKSTTITVLNVNAPPVFEGLGPWTVLKGQGVVAAILASGRSRQQLGQLF
jgi:hypothetical protein